MLSLDYEASRRSLFVRKLHAKLKQEPRVTHISLESHGEPQSWIDGAILDISQPFLGIALQSRILRHPMCIHMYYGRNEH